VGSVKTLLLDPWVESGAIPKRGRVAARPTPTLSSSPSLGVSIHPLHAHFERLHDKLGITARAQLVQRVMQEFLALTALPGNALPPICANQATGRCPLRL